MAERRICLTFDPRKLPGFPARAEEIPPADAVELRADLMDQAHLLSGAWRELPRRTGRDWVFTWRSPREGGAATERPPGIWAVALEAGFRWIDVEARELEEGSAEAAEAPFERRWVSAHPPDREWSLPQLESWFDGVRRHPAALHKLVVWASRFEQAVTVAEFAERVGGGPYTVFAQGFLGQVSRILGGLRGNQVTFAAAFASTNTAPGQPDVDRLVRSYRFADLPAPAAVYGLVGESQVLRSLSPVMHNAVLAQEGIPAVYLPLPTEDPDAVFAWLRRGGAAGLSVTMPFKAAAAAAADVRTPRVEAVGVANTLWMEDGLLHADNTDLLAAEILLGELPDGPVAVLGAGGAAAAVVAAARGMDRPVTVFNRTQARGAELAARFGAVARGTLQALEPREFAVVVNATPIGPGEATPPFSRRPLVTRDWTGVALLDLTYRHGDAAWEILARERGLAYRGGKRFLAEQAVGQFARWTGRQVPSTRFLEALG